MKPITLLLLSLLVSLCASGSSPAQEPPRPELVLQTTWHGGDGRPVTSVALTSDGKYAVTGGGKTAFLWDTATGKKLRTFEGHTNGISGVAISGDGKHVVSASYDSTAILWDAASGKKLHTFTQDGTESKTPPYGIARICSMAFSADGKNIVTGSWQTATLWEAGTGKKLRTILAHDGWIDRVALSGDGKYVVTAPWDKTAILWESATGKKLQTFQGVANDRFSCLTMSSDGTQVVTVGHHRFSDGKQDLVASSREVVVWDSATGKQLHTLRGHTRDISGVALTSDGKHVLTASWDTTAILWETQTGKKIRTFEGHTGNIRAMALSADGRRVITGSQDHTAIVWDVASGKKLQTLRGPADKVSALALSGDGRRIATSGRTVGVWDAGGKKIQTLQGRARAPYFESVALSGDGARVAAGSPVEKAILWDTASGKELQTFEGYDNYWRYRVNVALNGDGRRMLNGGNQTAFLWDTASGQKLQDFKGHPRAEVQVLSVALSRDGKLVVTRSTDKTAILWDATSGKKLHTFEEHTSEGVALSGDGKRVLTSSVNKTAVLWDAASGQKLRTFTAPAFITSMALSHDGNRVAVGCGGTAILWDAADDKKPHTFAGHTDRVTGVALSDNGKHLWTVSDDRTTRLWDTTTGKERCQLYSLNDGKNWLVVTPDGFFDGCKDAWRFVAYREPGTLELLEDVAAKAFHRPGLLARVWKGDRVK